MLNSWLYYSQTTEGGVVMSWFNLLYTINHYVISVYCDHYTTSVICCKHTFYCKVEGITKYDMNRTRISSAVYSMICQRASHGVSFVMILKKMMVLRRFCTIFIHGAQNTASTDVFLSVSPVIPWTSLSLGQSCYCAAPAKQPRMCKGK